MASVQVIKENSLGINRGLYGSSFGNALSAGNIATLLAEGAAVNVGTDSPGLPVKAQTDASGNVTAILNGDGSKAQLMQLGSIQTTKILPPISAAAAANFTLACQFTSEAPFNFVRVCLVNETTSSYVVDKMIAASPAVSGDLGSTLTWYPITFDSSASAKLGDPPLGVTGSTLSVTVPAATGSGVTFQYGEVWSDWIYCQSTPRSDGGFGALVQIRGYRALAGQCNKVETGVSTQYNSLTSRKILGGAGSGDRVTTPTALTITENGYWFPVNAVQFALTKPIKQIGIFGDSLHQGHVTAYDNFYGWPVYALEAKARETPIQFFNYSRSGQKISQTWLWAKKIIPQGGLDYAVFCPISPNDGAPTNALTAMQYVILFINLCKKNNVIPIIRASMPWSANNSASDAIRLQINDQARVMCNQFGAVYWDANAVVTNGATPQRIATTYDQDGTHLNANGYSALGLSFPL